MASSFSNAPALSYVLFFIPGIILQSRICCPFWLLLSLLILCSLALLLARKAAARDIFAILCILLCGATRYALAEEAFRGKSDIPALKGINITATVIEQRTSPYHIESYILEFPLGEEKIRANLYARANTPLLFPGKRYHLENVDLLKIEAPVNPYAFDYRSYAKRQGISHRVQVKPSEKVTELGMSNRISYIAYRVREKISVRYLAVLGIEKGSLVNGLLLGMRSEIPHALADMFRHLGISHLLAVSGLHVGLIVLIIFQLLNLLSLPRFLKTLLLTAFLLFYCQLSGGSPSVMRASLMTMFLVVAPLFRRRYQGLNGVASAAMILLLANPYYLKDLGFQFSFAAVAGIMLGYKLLKEALPLRSKNPLISYVYDGLMVSASASLFTAPVALYYFDTIQAASLILNLVAIPLTFCVMICAMLCLPCLFLPGFISDLFFHALDLSLEVFRVMLRLSAQTGIWTLQMSAYWRNILLFSMLILLILFFIRRKLLRNLICLLLFVLGCFFFYKDSRPELVHLSLPRGQALAFRCGREALIVNTGAIAFNSNDYERSIKALCKQWGIRNLHILITSDEKNKTGSIPHIRRDYPSCSILTPPGGIALDVPHIPLYSDSVWTMGSFQLCAQSGESDLSLFIAGKKDTIFIGENLCEKRKYCFSTRSSPEKALHLRCWGKSWRAAGIQ